MKTLYLDCSMGAAGDMIAAALLELTPDPDAAVAKLNAIGIPGVEFSREKVVRGGIAATRLHVHVHGEEEGHPTADDPHHHHDPHHYEHHHHHEHHSLEEILHLIGHLEMPQKAKDDAAETYRLIAAAESRAHGRPVDEVHFHEVGALDAVADISAAAFLMGELGVERVAASPVNMGGGTVRCAHGVLPVPAPATAYLLEGVCAYGDDPAFGELCTPTGAALLRRFARTFGPMPAMRATATGHGAGGRECEGRANMLRATLGESAAQEIDEVVEISCCVDDMTGEEVAFANGRIFAAGALDVTVVPVQMKKGRPGVKFEVLCREATRESVEAAIFKHTTTLGMRETTCRRRLLARREEKATLPCGAEVRRKVSKGCGVYREKIEFEDLSAIAIERGCSLREAAAGF